MSRRTGYGGCLFNTTIGSRNEAANDSRNSLFNFSFTRPRSSVKLEETEDDTISILSGHSTISGRRGRGRPPKNSIYESQSPPILIEDEDGNQSTASSRISSSSARRKRGRPPKNVTIVSAPIEPEPMEIEEEEESSPQSPPPKVKNKKQAEKKPALAPPPKFELPPPPHSSTSSISTVNIASSSCPSSDEDEEMEEMPPPPPPPPQKIRKSKSTSVLKNPRQSQVTSVPASSSKSEQVLSKKSVAPSPSPHLPPHSPSPPKSKRSSSKKPTKKNGKENDPPFIPSSSTLRSFRRPRILDSSSGESEQGEGEEENEISTAEKIQKSPPKRGPSPSSQLMPPPKSKKGSSKKTIALPKTGKVNHPPPLEVEEEVIPSEKVSKRPLRRRQPRAMILDSSADSEQGQEEDELSTTEQIQKSPPRESSPVPTSPQSKSGKGTSKKTLPKNDKEVIPTSSVSTRPLPHRPRIVSLDSSAEGEQSEGEEDAKFSTAEIIQKSPPKPSGTPSPSFSPPVAVASQLVPGKFTKGPSKTVPTQVVEKEPLSSPLPSTSTVIAPGNLAKRRRRQSYSVFTDSSSDERDDIEDIGVSPPSRSPQPPPFKSATPTPPRPPPAQALGSSGSSSSSSGGAGGGGTSLLQTPSSSKRDSDGIPAQRQLFQLPVPEEEIPTDPPNPASSPREAKDAEDEEGPPSPPPRSPPKIRAPHERPMPLSKRNAILEEETQSRPPPPPPVQVKPCSVILTRVEEHLIRMEEDEDAEEEAEDSSNYTDVPMEEDEDAPPVNPEEEETGGDEDEPEMELCYEAIYVVDEKRDEYARLRNAEKTGNQLIINDEELTGRTAMLMEFVKDEEDEDGGDGVQGYQTTVSRMTDKAAMGYVRIRARTVVPFQMFEDRKMFYTVLKGEVQVKSGGAFIRRPGPDANTNYLFGKLIGATKTIVIPEGTVYSLENWGEEDVLLFCSVIKI